MNTIDREQNAVYIPPELLAEARQAATEEHRPADELVSDAVRRYLQQRKSGEVAQPSAPHAKRTRSNCLNRFADLMWNSRGIHPPVAPLICDPVPSRYQHSVGSY